jgi:hypothetical protein
MSLPEDISEAPAAFNIFRVRINQMLKFLRAVESMEGTNGVKVSVSDNRIVIDGSAPPDAGGGGGGGGDGLPDGYGPEEWTVYDGGVVTTRNFLTDNPD